MRTITFNVPVFAANDGGDVLAIETRTGHKIWLELFGTNKRRAFVLQRDGNGRPTILTDYASGYRLTDLGPLMLRSFVGNPYAHREMPRDWRWQAQLWLDATIERQGLKTVQMKLDSVPVINS